MKNSKQELILWKFKAYTNFWFFIPDDRDFFWWDFFVSKKNFAWAKDWDLVKAIEIKSTWKKPEAKIVSIKWQEKTLNDISIEWVFSFSNEGDWWYIDLTRLIDGKKIDKWYFVHKTNQKWAKSWDKVKAKLQKHKGKLEAIIVKILTDERGILSGKYKENKEFWFVITWWKTDIFVPHKWSNNAVSGDEVQVKIIDDTWRRPTWIIIGDMREIVNKKINSKKIEIDEDPDFNDDEMLDFEVEVITDKKKIIK